MIPKQDRTNSLEILEDNELLLGQLYRTYAEKFPDHDDLWSGFATEQIKQAKSIHGLRTKAEVGAIALNGDWFPSRELRIFREHIKGLLYTAMERAAIEAAAYIQWSLLKQGVFGTLREDPQELRHVLTGLAFAACRRRDRLLEALEETRRTPPETETPEVGQYGETRDPLPPPGLDVEYNHLGYYPFDL